MARSLLALVALAVACTLTGCASTESKDSDRVSSIPWNRPERWEGAGPLGGMMNTN